MGPLTRRPARSQGGSGSGDQGGNGRQSSCMHLRADPMRKTRRRQGLRLCLLWVGRWWLAHHMREPRSVTGRTRRPFSGMGSGGSTGGTFAVVVSTLVSPLLAATSRRSISASSSRAAWAAW